MHYFIEHTKLTQQIPADAFGVDISDPTIKFNTTSLFQLTNQAKAFACQDGMMIVQQSEVDNTMVNVILKPIESLKVNFNKIKYYVYRGVLKSSLIIDEDTIAAEASTNNEFIARLWQDHHHFKSEFELPDLPDPTPKVFGYNNSLASNLRIEKIYDYSQEDTQAIFIKQGEWFGDYATTNKIGLEIVTSSERITIDLAYLKKGKHHIDVAELTGLELRAKKEEILSFIDPAAFWGLHYDYGIKISSYSGGQKITEKKKQDELFNLMIEKFHTKNKVYLDIRSEFGYSYNFYQNYGDDLGENIKIGNIHYPPVSRVYGNNEWPIIIIETPINTVFDISNVIINLRIDDNSKPLLFIENKDLLDPANNSCFVDEHKLLNGTATDWSKEISLRFPNTGLGVEKDNVAYYIKLSYFRQTDNTDLAQRTINLEESSNFKTIFPSIDTPFLGDNDYIFQQTTNEYSFFIEGELLNEKAFSGMAITGANFDANRIVFHTRIVLPKQTTIEFYPQTKSSIGHGIELEGHFNQISFLKRDIYCYTQTIQENSETNPIKILDVYAYNGYPGKKENLFLLGLMQSEFEMLKTVGGLSNKHNRFIVFEDISPYPSTDIKGKPYRKYKLKVQGLDGNGVSTVVAPSLDIIVYTTGISIFCSKGFSNVETGAESIFYPLDLSIAENNFLEINDALKSYFEKYLINNATQQGFAYTKRMIKFLMQNSSGVEYFSEHQQDLEIFYIDNIASNDIEEIAMANTSANLITDVLVNLQNDTLSDLDISWPNLEILKLNIKNAISKGIYTTAKYVRDYLYIPMYKMGNKYPSTVYWANKAIDKLRTDVVAPLVNFNENTMDWGDLFNIWIFELTPGIYVNDTIDFSETSNLVNGNDIFNPTTNAVKNFPKGNSSGTLLNIETRLADGLGVGQTVSGYFKYDVNAFYSTLSNFNAGIQMLGSFPIEAKVISKSGNTAVVQFFIYNFLGWESGTRFIKGKSGKGNQGIIDDKPVGTGLHLGGTIRNNFKWKETIIF